MIYVKFVSRAGLSSLSLSFVISTPISLNFYPPTNLERSCITVCLTKNLSEVKIGDVF